MTTTSTYPRHPDTIPHLAPDCRRVLRESYAVIQARALRSDWAGHGAAVLDYCDVASLWDVPTGIDASRWRRRAVVCGECGAPRRDLVERADSSGRVGMCCPGCASLPRHERSFA